VSDYFGLYQPEITALHALASLVRKDVLSLDPTITGFNLGVNAGTAAGQTVDHVHLHVIPRRKGDVNNPKGGIRGVIPGQADYTRASSLPHHLAAIRKARDPEG
jgi:diadenosine tetraphosphate (Ap4A) HIT family hydrolase